MIKDTYLISDLRLFLCILRSLSQSAVVCAGETQQLFRHSQFSRKVKVSSFARIFAAGQRILLPRPVLTLNICIFMMRRARENVMFLSFAICRWVESSSKKINIF